MAELNVDGKTVQISVDSTEQGPHQIIKTKREVVELQNRYVCCTLHGDLIREINRIQELGQWDYVLIESTGIVEPQQVAESSCVEPETK